MGVSTVSVSRFAVTCFLVTAVPFGIASGLLAGVAVALLRSPWLGAVTGVTVGVVAGTLVGVMMTLLLGLLHRRSAQLPDGALADVFQSASFRVEGDLPDCVAAATRALEGLGVVSPREERGDVVVLEGRTSTSWKSWGEIVRVELGPPAGSSVPVHVISRPAWRTTIADYGKNLANVEAIRGAMAGVAGTRT